MVPEFFTVELVSWASSYDLSRKLAEMVRKSGYCPDLIIAIGKGGYVPSRIVADFLLKSELTSIKIEHWGIAAVKKDEAIVRYPLSVPIERKKVLVIDDVTDTGKTLQVSISYLRDFEPLEIRTGVLQHKTCSAFEPDYYVDQVPVWRWIVYPWAQFEDLAGFVDKVIRDGDKSPGEIARILKSRYGISLVPGKIGEILDILLQEGMIRENMGRYTSLEILQ